MIEIGINEITDDFFYHGYSDSLTDWIGDHCRVNRIHGNNPYRMYNITKDIHRYLPYIKMKVELITIEKYPEEFL